MHAFTEAFEDARKHARQCYPQESCGLIVKGVYAPCENHALPVEAHIEGDPDCPCKLCSFVISGKDMMRFDPSEIEMILHSHPDGPMFPSKADMQGQIETGLPWGIISLDHDRIGYPKVWGGEIPPLLGREFLHGVTDCYSMIRDTFALGREKLAENGISDVWPYDPVILPEFARADAWWEGDEDLYQTEPFKIGFREVKLHEARPGDVFLMSIKSEKLNHGGVLVTNDLIMHHLPLRVSRREAAGIWARHAARWLRYEGVPE